jgi:hypothetical protein
MMKKYKSFLPALFLLVITGLFCEIATLERLPWILTSFLCFGGIVLFDFYRDIIRSAVNFIVFFAVYALVLGAMLSSSPDVFWRSFAGALFLISLLFEQNALAWSGFGPFRTTVTPSIIFLMLILVQSIPYLGAPVIYSFSLAAILFASYLEVFCIFRENSAMNAGSFMSALRLASVGLCVLFYCHIFLPDIAHQVPFKLFYLALPALGALIAIVSLFLQHWRRRQILFYCNWSIFVFWTALSGEPVRFFAAIGALIAGVWSIMMTGRETIGSNKPRDLYLKLSVWGVPGSFLFTMIVFSLAPSTDVYVRQGSAIWLLNFVVFWVGLFRFSLPISSDDSAQEPTSLRKNVAVIVTILGASLLSGMKVLPEIMNQIWNLGK